MRSIISSIAAAITALTLIVWSGLVGPRLHAQGYSGAIPNVSATSATGLGLTYTAGIVPQGGAQTSITGSTLSATDSKTSCASPGYTGCNFVYWPGSGSSLSITTTASTAFAVGNVVIAFVTATGGNILAVTPASWSPATADITLRPTGGNTGLSYWVPPTACNSSVSAGATGTNGYTVLGTAPSIPVVQADSDNTAVVHVHYYTCNITPPSVIGVTGRGANLVSADFFYGVQTSNIGTQATVGASGTMNAKTVFTKIAYPTAGASQTPTGLAEASRADSGTLAYSDLTNVATTTAGEFYTITFTPATSFAMTGVLTQYFLTVSLLNVTTSTTITNSPGVLIHYTN